MRKEDRVTVIPSPSSLSNRKKGSVLIGRGIIVALFSIKEVQWSTRCGGHSGYEKGMGGLKGRLIVTLRNVLASVSMYYSME